MNTLIVDTLKNAIPSLTCVYLFGSVAHASAGVESDIDIAFLATEPVDNVERFDIAQKLATKLGKNVDLVDLRHSSEVFNMQIVARGECLLNLDESGFEDSVYYRYIDLNEQRAEILEDIRERGYVYG